MGELTPITDYFSWGRLGKSSHRVYSRHWRDEPWPTNEIALPYGMGRSYGDSCLNPDGALLAARGLDRFLSVDWERGALHCEGGVTLDEILRLIVPRGWMLPVAPGTRFVTIGGAIANDVHGKNHHRAGTLGRFVRRLVLSRSDGSQTICSPDQHSDLFRATIGGLGMTGLILSTEIELQRIASPWLEHEVVRFRGLDDFFAINESSEAGHEFTVAWVDCLKGGGSLGRGVYLCANFADHSPRPPREKARERKLSVPFPLPSALLNPVSMTALNALYYRLHGRRKGPRLTTLNRFFFPLDRVRHWNRIYGRRGFYQYQLVVPLRDARDSLKEILRRISLAREGSFLAVLKSFGALASPGLLSFPREGITLALDFTNRGPETLSLMSDLDAIVHEAKGALYPAKDTRMSAQDFQSAYPRWREVERLRDPKISSAFWRRVTA